MFRPHRERSVRQRVAPEAQTRSEPALRRSELARSEQLRHLVAELSAQRARVQTQHAAARKLGERA
jgi:hypothetical protein